MTDFRSRTSPCYRGGDIIVARFAGRFRIGRVLETAPGGVLLQHVLTVVDSFEEALTRAIAMAMSAQRVAWYHIGGNDFEPLSRESMRHIDHPPSAHSG